VISVAAADLNHDGNTDLVVVDLLGLIVLIGNGDGTFQSGTPYAAPCGPYFASVNTGDVNGDHKLDLLVTYSSTACPYVGVPLGRGDGTFQEPPINTSPSLSPSAIGIGDFNRDGKLDAVVTEQFGTVSQVEVLLGDADGTFSKGAIYAVGSFPDSVVVTDFRHIGKQDLAVATLNGGVSVLLGNGDGTFHSAPGIGVSGANWLVSTDFNADGKADLAVSQFEFPSGVSVILGNGDGTFQPPVYYPAGSTTRFVAQGDFNGDHKLDLVLSTYDSGLYAATTMLNTGVVNFSPTTPVDFPFQLVGVVSPARTVSLTNAGPDALSISSIHVNGPFHQSNNCGKSVAQGAKCSIKLTFKPSGMGSFAGIVSISDSASSKAQVIEVSGAGTVVSLSPTTLTFPEQKVGTASLPQLIQVTNTGNGVLNVTSGLYISGNNFRDFAETNNCGLQIAAGASCNVTVTFTPKKSGKRTAYVGINDDGGGSPQTVPLTGTGD
jgi:hypothetical protein